MKRLTVFDITSHDENALAVPNQKPIDKKVRLIITSLTRYSIMKKVERM